MIVDNLFSVIHATIADLDGVLVEDFPEFVVFGEVFVYKGEESVTDIGANVFAERGIVPEDVVTLPVFLRLAVVVGS